MRAAVPSPAVIENEKKGHRGGGKSSSGMSARAERAAGLINEPG